MSRLVVRRLAYYAAVIVFGILAHQASTASLLGAGLSDFLRRNSEAYALAVLVPAYWDLFAWTADPLGHSDRPLRRSTIQFAWLGLLAACAVILQSRSLAEALDLPQSIVTLGEAFVAALVVAVYQGWTRGVLPGSPAPQGGRVVVPVRTSTWYYLGVGMVTILIYQSFAETILGSTVIEWFQINAEAYAAMLLVPFYFDFVAPSRHKTNHGLWYAFLVGTPLMVASGQLDHTSLGSLTMWHARTTESFLAAIVISLYFSWWRGPGRSPHASVSEMADGVM